MFYISCNNSADPQKNNLLINQNQLIAHNIQIDFIEPRLSKNCRLPPVVMQKTNSIPAPNRGEHLANCYNAALAWDFPDLAIQQTDPDFFRDQLSHYRLLGNEETIQFGDMAVIIDADRPPDDRLHFMHPFRIVGFDEQDLIIWHKVSWFDSDPWTFEY